MDTFDFLEFDSWSEASSTRPRSPSYDAAAYDRGRDSRQRGDFFEAAQWFDAAVDANDHDYAARVLHVDSLVRAQMYDDAAKASEAHLKRFPRVREHYASRALALGHIGQYDQAIYQCAVALEGEKISSYARCVRGELALLQNPADHETAMRWFEHSVDLADDRWESHIVSGLALLDADFPTLAAAFFAEAGHANAAAAFSWIGLGDCFAELRLYDQALFYYRRALQTDPGNFQALKREKKYAGGVFGLLHALHRPNLVRRWNDACDRIRKGH